MSCDCTEEIVNIPGAQGATGADGADGSDGISGYTYTTAPFTMPAVDSNVTISVNNSSWCGNFLPVFIENARWFEVQSVPDATSLVVKNLGYSDNASPGATIPSGSVVSPAGKAGSDGAGGSDAAVNVTTKGDLQTFDANPARKAVGSDGQVLTALASEATGLQWQTLLPSGSDDNVVPRFNAAVAATPMPVQTSSVKITDNGYLQNTGGNAKGTDATDLQGTRASAAQVASGTEATIGGGKNNTASGTDSTVAGGVGNTASGTSSAIGGGDANSATTSNTTVGGGTGNTSSQVNATVAGGNGNTANGVYGAIGGGGGNSIASSGYGTIPGGSTNSIASTSTNGTIGGGINNSLSGAVDGVVGGGNSNAVTAAKATVPGGYYGAGRLYGQLAHASGRFSETGDAQHSFLVVRAATTNNTQTEMFLDGSSSRISILQGYAAAFRIQVIGRRDNGDSAVWEVIGGIKNNSGTTSLIGSVTETVVAADAGCSGTWGDAGGLDVQADDTNDALVIKVTGETGQNIRWVASVELTELKY